LKWGVITVGPLTAFSGYSTPDGYSNIRARRENHSNLPSMPRHEHPLPYLRAQDGLHRTILTQGLWQFRVRVLQVFRHAGSRFVRNASIPSVASASSTFRTMARPAIS